MKDNFVVFVRSSSNRSANAVSRYEWVYYKCSRRVRQLEPPSLTQVVNVNGRHATNRLGCKLYTFLITRDMGTRRPVVYAFVESEQFAPLRKLFDLFKKMMGKHYPVMALVMDKLAVQMLAARVMFGCDAVLSYFQIRKAIRKHTYSANGRRIFHRMACLDNTVQWVFCSSYYKQILAGSAASSLHGPTICFIPYGFLAVHHPKIGRTRTPASQSTNDGCRITTYRKNIPHTFVPKQPPTALDSFRKQLNRVVDKLQGMETRRATAIFKQLNVQGQILLRQSSKSATDCLPSVVEDAEPQPRWWSRNTLGLLCAL
ncbi:hypothetical protein CSKR_109918 [Clonorchis sinensis]|uniref:ZSWIM1/3 RNaseH-like domain-containing protein n=1 Tax=Clonorchis sinensis TaxID=79923 RepID=A0A419PF31_CLOSI|nr:hypothetical protein CSKR_109918 [Clonorchis sinensis]